MNPAPSASEQPFLTDVKTLRDRARQHIEGGAVTAGYGGDTATAVKVLNDALATELVCVLRYKRHYFMAQGIHAVPVAAEFQQHASEEQEHADDLARSCSRTSPMATASWRAFRGSRGDA